MKRSVLSLLACLMLPVPAQSAPPAADAGTELRPQDLLTQRSLGRLEEKLGVVFNLPFPTARFDTDAYRRQPLAVLPGERGKTSITRPIVNPYDGAGPVEWTVGTADITQLGRISLDANVHLNDRGELIQISVLASPDQWTVGTSTAQLHRDKGETEMEFRERVLSTYRLRAKGAADPEQALLLFSGFETVLKAVLQCRKDEVAGQQ